MPGPRFRSLRPTASASAGDANGQGRDGGPSVTPKRASNQRQGRTAWPSLLGEVSVARPVVREADGHAVQRAATDAVSQDAAERAAQAGRLPMAPRITAPEQPSADLARLLGHLRTTVARYVGDRRQAGAPIQRVLPEVKGLVREAVAYEAWYDPAEALMQQVVGWTIAAYYAEPEPSLAAQEGVRVVGRRQ